MEVEQSVASPTDILVSLLNKQPATQQRQLARQVTDTLPPSATIPPVTYFDQQAGRIRNLSQEVMDGKVLTDTELKQLFHHFELWRYGAKTELGQTTDMLIHKLAANMSIGANALKNKEGYIIIGEQAYGTKEALATALEDLRYFQEHDTHLPPRYPANEPTDPRKTTGYPDKTRKIEQLLEKITTETAQTFHAYGTVGVHRLLLKNFPNNGDWDLQVHHGLPGQVVNHHPTPEEIKKVPKGRVPTKDQYVTFQGRVVAAGYLSNYTFGQALAAGEVLELEGEIGAQALALLFRIGKGTFNTKDLGSNSDNPRDIQAILDGYRAYRRTHSSYPTPGSFKNK